MGRNRPGLLLAGPFYSAPRPRPKPKPPHSKTLTLAGPRRRRHDAGFAWWWPPAAARGEGGAGGPARAHKGAPVWPGAAARERDRKRRRAGLELLRGERAGEDGAGLRDGWREDAERVLDLQLAGPEVAGGGRSAGGGGGPCASARPRILKQYKELIFDRVHLKLIVQNSRC